MAENEFSLSSNTILRKTVISCFLKIDNEDSLNKNLCLGGPEGIFL